MESAQLVQRRGQALFRIGSQFADERFLGLWLNVFQ